MNFKSIYVLILCCLSLQVAEAQRNVKVGYDAVFRSSTNDSLKTNKMILLADADRSLYYNQMSQYVDSLCSTPGGKKKLRQIQMAAWVRQDPDGGISVDKSRGNAPDKKVNIYVAKDRKTELMTVYDKWGEGLNYYNEPLSEMKWTVVGDSTAMILGYECFKAETDYHGRHWTAWFTPEIPIKEGPWKLHGLEGMILKAEANGGFLFVATGIELTDTQVPEIYSREKYAKGTRIKLLRDHDYYENNVVSILAAQGIKVSDPSNFPGYTAERHAIEPDYENK